jgi:hypothetical protein
MRLFAVLAAAAIASGCIGSSESATTGPGALAGDGAVFVAGRVVDDQIVPLENVTVTGGDHLSLTDANGSFLLGPFLPGETIVIRGEKAGYADAEQSALIVVEPPIRILLTLQPVSTNVPYYATIPHVAFIECAWAGPIGSLPCNPVDRQLGTNFTNDQSQWYFSVPGAGVVALLHEATWQANAFGRDMRFLLFHPDLVTGSAVGGDPYLDARGPSPRHNWLVAGEEAQGAAAPFDATEGFQYQALYRPWTTNSTIPGWAVYIQHRVENFYTYFYHRQGPQDFSVLPDQ